MFVHEIRYFLTEYDPGRPWVLVKEARELTVQLADETDFTAWAARAWPSPRYKAQRVPDALRPWRPTQ
jgi:hypothetical protein